MVYLLYAPKPCAADPISEGVTSRALARTHRTPPTHLDGCYMSIRHVFHGISERGCESSCYENPKNDKLAGRVTGDLCSDTAPAPMDNKCANSKKRSCDFPQAGGSWPDTPFRNYMAFVASSPRSVQSPTTVGCGARAARLFGANVGGGRHRRYTRDSCMSEFTPMQIARCVQQQRTIDQPAD